MSVNVEKEGWYAVVGNHNYNWYIYFADWLFNLAVFATGRQLRIVRLPVEQLNIWALSAAVIGFDEQGWRQIPL
jgi:hypothetical protein